MKRYFDKLSKKRIAEYAVILMIFVLMAVMVFGLQTREYSFERFETGSMHYVRGVVTQLKSETLNRQDSYVTGQQTVLVKILEGDLKGQYIEIDNYISATHNVVLKNNTRVIVCADMPEGVAPYYSIYNYDRSGALLLLGVIFLLLVIVIGRKKGLMSCIGLLFTLCMVICFLLPRLYEGEKTLPTVLLTIISSTAVTCFCISGFSRKTLLNIISTVLGCASAGLMFRVMMAILHISGTTIEEIESLVVISRSTGLELTGILFSGIMISTLGAVMDVAVSIGAAMAEIQELNLKITAKELLNSGMNIGRDMIGTMTNTLILAFAGGSLATLLVLISCGVQYNQLLSSDFIALEVAQGLAGSAAVVLTVPISAAICALGYGRPNLIKKEKQ